MSITELIVQSAFKFVQLPFNLKVLLICLLECLLVELFLSVDEEHLILFACQNLRKLYNTIMSFAESDNLVPILHLPRHA